MKCPNCGTESDGAFCPECGVNLEAGDCPSCGEPLQPGARFCTSCGEKIGGGRVPQPARAGGGFLTNLPWYVAGVAFVALATVLVVRSSRDEGAAAGAGAPFAGGAAGAMGGGAPAGGAVGGGAPGPLTGTPREQADRLFNRIMSALQSGDTQQADFFMPMGIQAYQMVPDLDADGLYHLSLLESAANKPADALATAKKILAGSPDHLLGLAAAAQAANKAGQKDQAADYWRHYLRVYDAESGRTVQEYSEHKQVLPEYRSEAEAYLKQG